MTTNDILKQISQRLSDYEARGFSREIADFDDMYLRWFDEEDALRQYFAVGASAVDVIAAAMVLSQRTGFPKILDLPAGAGRVARHLVALFPDSKLYVADINTPLVEWAAKTFAVELLTVRPDFSEASTQTFDLVFVGSLLTHLPQPSFRRRSDLVCRCARARRCRHHHAAWAAPA